MRSASFAVGGLLLVRRSAFLACGGFDPAAEGVDLFDLCLRLYEAGGGAAIGHVAEVLYLRHPEGGHSLRGTDEMVAARNRSLLDHLHRCGLEASLDEGYLQGTYRLRYRHAGHPLVSIIVPTKNQRAFLARCLSTLVAKTAYPNFEVLVVDNGSTEPDALAYLAGLPQADARIRVLASPGPFNFAAMNNQAAREARGEYLLLLNNDTAVLHEDWLDEMMAHARRPEVGVVGARLIYPTGKIQHAGVVLGLNNSPADHPYLGSELADVGYYGRLQLVQDLSAVTGACLLVARPLYEQVGGLDEAAFQVSFNDIDLCLKIGELGRLIVWTPFATLLHEGSASQASETERATLTDRQRRFLAERQHFYAKWRRQIAFDPAYNRNLSLRGRYPEAEPEAMLRLAPDDRPRPRILAHPGDRAGSGEYRVLAPMRALNGAGRVDGLESSRYLGVPELIRFEPDSIVLQRQIENRNIELIEGYARNSRAFKVFELDDLLFNPPVRHVASAQVANLPELKKRLRKAIGLCDRLVVSTDYLAEAMREYATDIVVCPNYIEAARWQGLKALRRAAAKPRIGWAGSLGHEGDLALIVDVVKATLAEADWVFLGYCPESLKAAVEFHPLVKLDDYPAKLASLNLDLAVAPLEDLPFNHAKSHLRLLEYGALGCPVVCSDVTPYRGEFPVRRVRNRHREWLEAIRGYLAEPDELQRAGATLRQFVTERWTLETHLESWLKAWMP
ncbi:glycosyltransferase [Parasulfuritortus cantonensis]|uniref:Glycosyltransferase n=1 Tax=Parasulfuritortus cantonensis TaxID=2528202 RepID=A0A4R1BL61_9PROT|nr:glycosyltransferase [Parasulfuritortus cantonensis]